MALLDSPAFRSALRDYRLLLGRGYPRRGALDLVGNRYALDREARSVLARGVCSRAEAASRRRKRLRGLRSRTVHVDGYNVLLTVSSYLSGRLLFVAMDGFLRDAAEYHGKGREDGVLGRAIDVVVAEATRARAAELLFYMDSPVAHSGRVAALLRGALARSGLRGDARVVRSPDFLLKRVTEGVVATSDSAIIDACRVPVVDLARRALAARFAVRPVSLEERR